MTGTLYPLSRFLLHTADHGAGGFVLRLDLVRRHAAFARPRRVWIGPQAGDR